MSKTNKQSSPSTEDGKIQELLTRGVERVFPSNEFLAKILKGEEKQTLYLGLDPTGPSLHMGHVVPLLKLRQFQELGHKIILLVGDFTGMIGDPTDKSATRTRLTRKEVLDNAKMYKEQASKIISFEGENPASLKYNSEWLGKLSFEEFHEISALITTDQLMKRDMFEKRQRAGKPIYIHEFVYPILQGYDSVTMNVEGEVGGNDQTFNMLVGRDLVKKMKGKEKFVVAMKLLADSAGKKMGKTEGNMVSFLDSPKDCFGKIMSWSDETIIPALELCTLIPTDEIKKMEKSLEEGTNPKDIKLKLAEAVVALFYSEDEATKAHEGFDATFSEGKPEEFTKISFQEDMLADQLVLKGLVSSKSELRRLVDEGAVTNLDTGEKVKEEFLKTTPPGKYRIGKHRFVEIH